MHSEKFLKTIKLLMNPFIVMLQNFFTQRAIKGKLSTQRALQGYSNGTLGSL